MKNQHQLILNHMRAKGSITTLIAARLYDIYRLAARIPELEKPPFNCVILHTPVQKRGRRYMAYSLVEYGKKAA